LLTFALIVAGVAMVAAAYGLFRARRAAARAEQLSESYWELRYEIGQLKARVNRLETSAGFREAEPDAEVAAPRPASTTTFVPLSSLKK
jgi:hypothetical protein